MAGQYDKILGAMQHQTETNATALARAHAYSQAHTAAFDILKAEWTAIAAAITAAGHQAPRIDDSAVTITMDGGLPVHGNVLSFTLSGSNKQLSARTSHANRIQFTRHQDEDFGFIVLSRRDPATPFVAEFCTRSNRQGTPWTRDVARSLIEQLMTT